MRSTGWGVRAGTPTRNRPFLSVHHHRRGTLRNPVLTASSRGFVARGYNGRTPADVTGLFKLVRTAENGSIDRQRASDTEDRGPIGDFRLFKRAGKKRLTGRSIA
jgi:hypothetical protein